MRRVTLKEVAAESGYSFSLVSKVLRGCGIDSIRKETIEHIRKTADNMGYVVNHTARSLKTGKSHVIALGIPLGDNFASTIYPIITEVAVTSCVWKNITYDVIPFINYGGYKENDNLRRILSMNPDAIIYATPPEKLNGVSNEQITLEILSDYTAAGHPLAFVMDAYNIPGSCTFILDNREGGFRGTEHLIGQGCRNIYHFRSYYHTRNQGYVDAMRNYGLSDRIDISENYAGYSFKSGYDSFTELYNTRGPKNLPDAIFGTCDIFAMGMIKSMREHGISENDIHIMGYDGLEISPFTDYRFATVVQPVRKITTDCLKSVLDWLETGNVPESRLYEPKIELYNM